jgi:hypothetical protein
LNERGNRVEDISQFFPSPFAIDRIQQNPDLVDQMEAFVDEDGELTDE